MSVVEGGRRPGPSTRVRVREWSGDQVTAHEDRLATEEPLELRVAWPGSHAQRFVVTMRTPGDDFALAAGLTYAEGVHRGADDVDRVAYCTDQTLTPEQEYNVVTVDLRAEPLRWRHRTVAATAACGVCGVQSLDDVAEAGAEPLPVVPTTTPDVVRTLPDALRERQRVFDRTGGLHAAGLFDAEGSLLDVREDIGRHNAVDKVVGAALLERRPTAGRLLCVSGRVGYEIVQKAAVAGIAVVAAVGAPSSLSVGLAERFGITVAGFVRDRRMVVYSHPERLD